MKKAKKFVMSALAAMTIVGLTACGPQANTGNEETTASGGDKVEEIKIGLVLAETGPASTLGLPEVNTAKLLQKQLDAAGPVNGKNIKLLVQDYETDDTKAVMAMDRLISEGVVAVVGASQVSTTKAILPKTLAAKLPFLTVAPINTENESVFVTPPSAPTVATLIIDWLQKNNISKVAWVNAKDAFGVDGLPSFEALSKENNIQIVAHEEFDATATDMTVQLTNVKKSNPEAVIVWSRTPGAGIVARNFKALGFNVPMIQSTAAANQGFLDQVKENNKDIFVVGSKLSVADQLPDSEQKKRLISFRDAYKAEYNTMPDLFAAHAHDSISILVEAIKKGKTTPEEITEFLNKDLGKYEGITGSYEFSKDRTTSQPDGMAVLGIENNQWKYEQ